MGYTLSPLHSPTPLTFPRLVQTFDAAFSDHPLIPYLYPHTPPQARLENDVKKFEGEWARREAEGLRWWVVREDGEGEGDGEIVAWAKWVVPHEIGEEERKSGEIGGWPEGANVELCEEFFGKLREGRRRWVGEGEYCEFLFLCSRDLMPQFVRTVFDYASGRWLDYDLFLYSCSWGNPLLSSCALQSLMTFHVCYLPS